MDEIIGTIAERLGLDEGTVASVVEAVFGFLKDNPEKAVGLLADIPGLEGLGEISGNRLVVAFPDGGGCGLVTVEVPGRFDYLGASDTLVDQDEVIWARALGGD